MILTIREWVSGLLMLVATFVTIVGWMLLKCAWSVDKCGMSFAAWRNMYGIPEMFEED